jgi:pyruvate dehydrogenase E2 component (dihydrolipoamide acetyltransferase)
MATYIEMPKLADTMMEGTLVKWRKKEGDAIAAGDVVAEVETDKATMEVESFEDGILAKYLVEPGTKVPILTRMALVLQKGEKAPEPGSDAPAPAPAAKAEGEAKPAPAPSGGAQKAAGGAPAAAAGGPRDGERVKSSPLARKIAKEKGVSLAGVSGSGPGGRVVARDVEGAQASRGAAAPQAASASATPWPAVKAGENDQKIALSGMRRVIADRLLQSKTQIPHFYLHIEVDAGPLMQLRSELNAASEASGGPKLTVNDFILKAVVAAAQKVPAVNASFAGDSIVQFAAINLSVAVAVEEGLVTPVIRDAGTKSIRAISEAVKDLAARARSKKLKPDEYAGGTITVSNLGAYGIEFFDAIINPPQSIIVSAGAIVKKPVVGANEQIVVGQRVAIGLSADHRVVDGAVGAAYLAELRKLIESPTLMLI